MKHLIAVIFALLLPFPIWAGGCDSWNSEDFFKEATLVRVTSCLADGAAINALDEEYSATPLHYAALESENPAMIAALLEAGADGTARTSTNETPFDEAKHNENLKGTEVYWRLGDAQYK